MRNKQLTKEGPVAAPPKLCAKCQVQTKPPGKGRRYCDGCAATLLCTKCDLRLQASPSSPWCLECKRKAQNEYRAKCIDRGLCVDCGIEKHRPNKRTCDPCEEKRKPSRKTKRLEFKSKAVSYLGGACMDCGFTTEYLDVFDFHHRDPTQKELTIGLAMSVDWEVVKTELSKCDLLCSNCHRIRHAKNGWYTRR